MPSWFVDIIGGILNGLALIALAIWGTVFALHKDPQNTSKKRRKNSRLPVLILWVVAVLIIASIAFQINSAFRHYVSDTEPIKYYDEKFDQIDQKRILACIALKEYYQKGNWNLVTNSTDGLDYVLGFWDNLGYDVQHGKISPQVAWQYFYDDIANYYQGSAEYIATAQQDDPTYFESLKPLYDSVAKIEAERRHCSIADPHINQTNYLEYLRSEIDLAKTGEHPQENEKAQ